MFFQKNYRLLTYGPEMNNILAKPVEESEWPQLQGLFEYMVEVMRRADGIGLAAPQIGCFKQFLIVQMRDGSIVGLVNPEIMRLYGKEVEGSEGCLSLPPRDNTCMVPRLENIDVEAALYHTPEIRKQLTFHRGASRIIQHELDHLTGTFFIDRVPEVKKREALDRFHHWKAIRKAQIRKMEENGNVHTRFVTALSGQSRVS